MAPLAVCLADLPRLAATQVRVHGRLVGSPRHLDDATALVRVVGADAHEEGTYVVGVAHWDGAELRWVALESATTPSRRFGHGASEYVVARRGPIPLRARLEAIAAARRAARDYFERRGFLEVETPIVVGSPGLDVHLAPVALRLEGPPKWLNTSPEYHMKRLLVAGIAPIFQLTKVFRGDEAGRLHSAEFTMLEWYRSAASFEEVVRDTHGVVRAVFDALAPWRRGHARPTLCDVGSEWEWLTVRDAFTRYTTTTMDLALRDEVRFYQHMVEDIEPHLGRGTPTILHRYPISMASLARPCRDDPSVAERFEVYAAGIELCNGFGELTDPVEQRRRFEHDLDLRRAAGAATPAVDERLLAALEDGMPPSAGNALGFDRLVLLALGVTELSDVLAFPPARA